MNDPVTCLTHIPTCLRCEVLTTGNGIIVVEPSFADDARRRGADIFISGVGGGGAHYTLDEARALADAILNVIGDLRDAEDDPANLSKMFEHHNVTVRNPLRPK